MKNVIKSLKSVDWLALLACFLYLDTGFTVWVMLGALAPFISKSIAMSPVEQGFLVAVPVLAAAILRVTLGNLFQSVDGRQIALMGVLLSAIPAFVLLLMPGAPSYLMGLILGVFLGMGGASFAVALPMAGSNYPRKVQGLVLGLAAAGKIGTVLDGFMFQTLASAFGWQKATAAALPLLALTALAIFFWAKDRSPKTGSGLPALGGFAVTLFGLIGLVLLVHAGALGQGKTGLLLLPFLGSLMAIAVLPQRYRTVADRARHLGMHACLHCLRVPIGILLPSCIEHSLLLPTFDALAYVPSPLSIHAPCAWLPSGQAAETFTTEIRTKARLLALTWLFSHLQRGSVL